MGKAGLTPEILNKVSSLVNAAIQQEMSVHTVEVPLDVAIDSGAIADFTEKYSQSVRVVSIGHGPNSTGAPVDDLLTLAADVNASEVQRFLDLLHAGELCGGTHVKNTADLFAFTVVRESGIGAGTRRLEALAGRSACVTCVLYALPLD